MEHNVIGWVEIPVLDMDRAKLFYETVFGFDIQVQKFNELLMGFFPMAEGKMGAAGSLVRYPEWYAPSDSKGPLVYFSCADLQLELDRVTPAGGKALQPKTRISEEHGFMGVFLDSEGNRIALHSMA